MQNAVHPFFLHTSLTDALRQLARNQDDPYGIRRVVRLCGLAFPKADVVAPAAKFHFARFAVSGFNATNDRSESTLPLFGVHHVLFPLDIVTTSCIELVQHLHHPMKRSWN